MNDKDLFIERLAEGHNAEFLIATVFLASNYRVQVVNSGSYRDLLIDDYWVEIKNEDRYARVDGNICVELFQGNPSKPSGISISESHLWIHKLDGMAAIYRTQKMRCFMKQNQHEVINFAGADNGNRGVIIPIMDLVENNWFAHCKISELPVKMDAIYGR